MVTVKYMGNSDIRILRPTDFQVGGVEDVSEIEEQHFPKGVEVKVTREMRDALVDNPKLYGLFLRGTEDLDDEAVQDRLLET